MKARLLMGWRTRVLESVEQAIADLFSSRALSRELEGITGSLAIYGTSTVDGGMIYSLAYDRGGTEFPTFLEGWWGYSLEELEEALGLVKQWVGLITCPAAFAPNPAVFNPLWLGWGARQAGVYLSSFHACACFAFAGQKPPDATGVG